MIFKAADVYKMVVAYFCSAAQWRKSDVIKSSKNHEVWFIDFLKVRVHILLIDVVNTVSEMLSKVFSVDREGMTAQGS